MIEKPIRSMYSVRKITPSDRGRAGEGAAGRDEEDTLAGRKSASATDAKEQPEAPRDLTARIEAGALSLTHRMDASALGPVFPLPVKTVQHAVGERSDQHADGADEDDAAEQGVGAGEYLAGVSLERGERPHAGKDHRRVGIGVDPALALDVMIAEHTDEEAAADDDRGRADMPDQPAVKLVAGQQRLGAVLVHAAADLA